MHQHSGHSPPRDEQLALALVPTRLHDAPCVCRGAGYLSRWTFVGVFMNSILDHLIVVIAIGAATAYFLVPLLRRRRKSAKGCGSGCCAPPRLSSTTSGS